MDKNKFLANSDYKNLILELKNNIKRARNISIRRVNLELISLYYNLGKKIVLKQKDNGWGSDLIGQIEKDLKKEFPDMKGFSRRNLFYMKKFYLFFNEEKVPQLVAQIPWSHIRVILDKIENKNEAFFYIQKTINNSWSRVILQHQIEVDLYKRQGKICSNFKESLDEKEVEIVSNSFKESYILDFVGLTEKVKEKDLEAALVDNITYFLMELGRGFAFVGRQKKIVVGGEDFFIDLLFYNYILRRFVVIEIKTCDFKPEQIGQIGFYITAINRDVKTKDDKETIGLLICKSKNKTVVEYALNNNKNPLGVAEFSFNSLPKDVKNCFPDEEDLRNILEN
jgi:predicted nuclease of restriction endonuclease-like (RecB) superfamily